MKTCKRCSMNKPINEFYTHPKMTDGHLNICKECVKNRVKKHRQENDSVREYDRWRYQNTKGRKEKATLVAKRWRERNPTAYKAHTALNNAIRDGKLMRQRCQICGDENSHAHHHDYTKPLDVEWLCAKHHHRKHHGHT
jgi:hypothetical protein